MKIKLEPKRFRQNLEAGMVIKGKPLIDPLMIKFSKKGALIANLYSNILAVHINLDKDYFLDFSSDDEIVSIPSIILDRLSWGFTRETMEVFTKDDRIFLKDAKDSFDIEIEDLEPKPFPFPLKDTKYGKILEKIELDSAVTLNAGELKLPSGKIYDIELKKGELSVKIEDEGNFVRKLEVKEVIGDKDIKLPLDGAFFNAVVANLVDDVTFVLNEDLVIFAEKRKDYTKTYILTANE